MKGTKIGMEVAVSPPPSKVTDDSGDESGAPRPLYESISLALRDSIHSVASQRNLFMGAPSTSSDEEKSTNKASLMDKEKEPDEMEKTGETVGTCSICFEDAALFTLSGCKHQFCVDCLGAYLEGNITERALPLVCPERDCETEIKNADVKQLVPPGMLLQNSLT